MYYTLTETRFYITIWFVPKSINLWISIGPILNNFITTCDIFKTMGIRVKEINQQWEVLVKWREKMLLPLGEIL